MKILLLLTILLVCAQQYHINYQAHSVTIFKFDVSLANEKSCLNYSTWKKGDDSCELLQYGVPSCCLLMRGDWSPVPIYYYPTNTTWEFIDIFESKKYDYILSKKKSAPRYKETKIIAVNLQFGPYAVNNLVENYLYNWFKAINDNDLNVEVIFGRNEFITDYDDLCARDTGCSERQKYISDFPVSLQSDSGSLPKLTKPRRFNFNTNFYNIEKFCANGFPKWVNSTNEFPMIFWEPSHEDIMQWTYLKYFNYTCQTPFHKLQLKDYQQANNQDPEMQQVYLQGLNETIIDRKFLFENKTQPVLEQIEQNSQFIFGFYDTIKEVNLLQVVNENMDIVQTLELQQSPQYMKKNQMPKNIQSDTQLLMVVEEKQIEFYEINPLQKQNPISKSLIQYQLPENYISSDIIFQDGEYSLLVLQWTENDGEIVLLQLNNKNNSQEFEVQQKKYFNVSKYTNKNKMLNPDFSFLDNEAVLLYNQKNKNGQLFLLSFQIDLQNLQNSIINDFKKQEIQKNSKDKNVDFIGYGVRPVIRLYRDKNDQIFFFIILTDGFSQNSVGYNNGYYNKCLYWKYEEFQDFTNLEHAMTYMYGMLEDLKVTSANQEIVSSCHPKIHYAHFNNGKRPSAVLRQNNKFDENYFTVFVLHGYADFTELPGPTRLWFGSNGRYNPNNSTAVPRPNKYYKIQQYTDSMMFEYFSVVDFEAFSLF
ncbi:hypothetical protein PPERSA_12025 [Pseudocohnilembus persalinus]|uniref:Uncharacterized protein n=1 Tax=Pseudocohnilembus persalinus TaxID=266149 RepID=A0A0V0R9H4_PSEPJ|nr:hypothetical protein PPERSA_12025 [Pseudocohnilembus persalinus]|eukprot:KRX10901.1 hypothetical protein PPERSA_12025 [Pseudocohnilembus persalinus]